MSIGNTSRSMKDLNVLDYSFGWLPSADSSLMRNELVGDLLKIVFALYTITTPRTLSIFFMIALLPRMFGCKCCHQINKNRIFSTPFQPWLSTNIGSHSFLQDHATSWSSLFGIILWRIWKNKNLFIFQNISLTVNEILKVSFS